MGGAGVCWLVRTFMLKDSGWRSSACIVGTLRLTRTTLAQDVV